MTIVHRNASSSGRFASLAGALIALLLLLLANPTSASALPERFFGMTAHESMNNGESDWEALANAGVQRFRMQIKWQTINEAGGGGERGWTNEWAWQNTYDQYFEKAAKHGIEIIPYLYTRKNGNAQYYWIGEPALKEWKEFVWTAVQRYGQAGSFWLKHLGLPQYPVTYWEVWNEPNLPMNCSAEQCNGKEYGDFLVATSQTIREAQSKIYSGYTAKVLFGGLYMESFNPNLGIASYLSAAAKAPGISGAYDGLSIHPYAIGLAGESRTYPDKVSGFKSNVSAAYNAQTGAGLGAKPLFITEVGWPVEGTGAELSNEAEQAGLLGETYKWLKANWSAFNVQFAAWYLYRDISDPRWQYHAGLRKENGGYRPAWYAYQAEAGKPEWPVVPSVWPSDDLGTPAPFGIPGIGGDPGISSWGKERLNLFARGNYDSGLYSRYYIGGVGWSSWEAVPGSGGKLAGGPDAVSWGNERVDVVGRGVSGQVVHWSWDGSDKKWYFDESLGGQIQGDPAIASWGHGRLDLFARGMDNGLWHRWFNLNTGWGPWELIPNGVLAGGPSAVSWGEGRIDVVARGVYGQVLHWFWDKSNSKWYFDESLGGQLLSDPTLSSWGTGRLDLFGESIDFRLWHRWYNTGTGWGPWEPMGGSFLGGGVDATDWAPGRIDVVARTYNNTVYHTAYQE